MGERVESMKNKYLEKLRSEKMMAFIFCLPALIPLTVFWIGPMVFAFYLSLTDWDFMMPTYNIVGLQNYYSLFQNPEFYRTLKNTLYFTAGSVLPAVFGGLLLAILLNRKLPGRNLYRTLIFSPWIPPLVAMAIVWSWMFNPSRGLINYIFTLVNLPTLPWATSSQWAMPVVIIVSVWRTLGYSMVFYLVALEKIPDDIYDAAEIDGVNFWSKLRHITLPLVSPTTLFLTIVLTIEALRAFDQIDIITQGGPAGATRTLLYQYYQTAFQQFNAGQAASIGIIILLIAAIFAIIQFWLSKRFVHYQ
ncbi:MAG: carbohydrate ABC transporter permease [Halanaerobiales bacterium]